MIVVSEIGEQWSPQTAPAIHAETQTMARGLLIWNTLCTIGISMPKVPQLDPVAKDSRQAKRKSNSLLWEEVIA